MQLRFIARAASLLAATAALGAVATGVASAHPGPKNNGPHGKHMRLYVSATHGSSGAVDRSCHTAGYTTIQDAVTAASTGDKVIVCKGTYTENITINTSLTLTGRGRKVVIDGSANPAPAIMITADNVTVQRLKVTKAVGEGILVQSASGAVIRHDRVVGNDTGMAPNGGSPYAQCNPVGEVPGDCGEGVHLMSATNSKVVHNFIKGNSGGVLITDELGAASGNLVAHNKIVKNLYDCGVTMPSHNPHAADTTTGAPQKDQGGVFDNKIKFNKIIGNGTLGEGAGVLIAAPFAGTASYDNIVAHNRIRKNELSGVTVHAHGIPPNAQAGMVDLNGNIIRHNFIGKNNTGGDAPDGPNGPSDPNTTGILVYSANGPLSITIKHNVIHNNDYGIWEGISPNVTITMAHNAFNKIGIQNVFSYPTP